ncbi:target of SBF [Neophaeococcomyces mojaviensis]|uniref:Target of SBF n=1 Tax=Neophaeococcomyces mojaviensis TaxID=3383035 RepID=A0ACC2ZZN2_9EURO|nr:target of SBF [Knufia sp. JES_112]
MDTNASRKDAELSSVGKRKSAASLLPAFEPLSSSPALPKTLKRSRNTFEGKSALPTPVPTSSTHILSSSPPHKSLIRTLSKGTERVPLGALPTVQVKGDGTKTKLGRSSQTCDYQLSANRQISRVHVEITYIPAVSRLQREKLLIVCIGWNGVKVHCQSKVYDLSRGAAFSSDIRDAEIMLDVHDSRVIIEWPEKPRLGAVSSDEDDFEASPPRKLKPMRRHSTPPSPSPVQSRKSNIAFPISPSPTAQALLPSSPPIMSAPDNHPPVDIFEDPETAELGGTKQPADVLINQEDEKAETREQSFESQISDLSSAPQDFSDNDEENDPIIHSFGPFGANLLPRLAAVNAGTSPLRSSPTRAPRIPYSEPLKPISSPLQTQTRPVGDFDVQSHVINQLAFSRLSSLPVSTILSHLPIDSQSMSTVELKQLIEDIPCIGEVAREGKDAAGKPLENEFYYIPDEDDDVNRKQAVVNDLRKPGLRACRRQHKQYYWKKPK